MKKLIIAASIIAASVSLPTQAKDCNQIGAELYSASSYEVKQALSLPLTIRSCEIGVKYRNEGISLKAASEGFSKAITNQDLSDKNMAYMTGTYYSSVAMYRGYSEAD